jgi:hypothetical protein
MRRKENAGSERKLSFFARWFVKVMRASRKTMSDIVVKVIAKQLQCQGLIRSKP